jgi:hypothetical protein
LTVGDNERRTRYHHDDPDSSFPFLRLRVEDTSSENDVLDDGSLFLLWANQDVINPGDDRGDPNYSWTGNNFNFPDITQNPDYWEYQNRIPLNDIVWDPGVGDSKFLKLLDDQRTRYERHKAKIIAENMVRQSLPG